MKVNVKRELEIIETGPNDLLYVIGDLEGHLPMLVAFLIDMKFIATGAVGTPAWPLRWIAPPSVWVAQIGDQPDSFRFKGKAPSEYDLNLFLFATELNRASRGRFLSIIGNHETGRILESNRDAIHADHLPLEDARLERNRARVSALLMRRNYVILWNRTLLSHAGVNDFIAGRFAAACGPSSTLREFVRKVNSLEQTCPNARSEIFSRDFKVEKEEERKELQRDRFHFSLGRNNLLLVQGHNKLSKVADELQTCREVSNGRVVCQGGGAGKVIVANVDSPALYKGKLLVLEVAYPNLPKKVLQFRPLSGELQSARSWEEKTFPGIWASLAK